MGEGNTPAQVLDALQDACGEPDVYATLLELLLAARLDELQALTGLPDTGLQRGSDELPTPPPRRSARRRR